MGIGAITFALLALGTSGGARGWAIGVAMVFTVLAVLRELGEVG